jgi:hypothetical protein
MNDGKIITGFSERLAQDKAVRALADAPTAFELEKRARALAAQGQAILKPMLRQLGTRDAALRGGLGLLAQHMDPMLIVPALRRVIRDTRRPDDTRLTAAMILERYLDVTLDPALLQTLPDSSNVARQSAEEALTLRETAPLIIVEYAEQLLEESDEVIETVIDVILSMDDPQRAGLLMAIASYAGAATAARILPTLGTIRHPESLHSLLTLSHLVEPALRPTVERQARKLLLAGVRPETPAPPRVLWSPVDAQGQSSIWIIRHHPATELSDLLLLLLHDDLGVVQAEVRPQMNPADLPMPAPVGYIHAIATPGSQYKLHMLEIELNQGRALVDAAASRSRENEISWPGELVVFGHWLWNEIASPRSEPAWPQLPAPSSISRSIFYKDLLNHKAFTSWAWDIPDLQQLLPDDDVTHILEKDSPVQQTISQRLVTSDATDLARRLERQMLWLTLANETKAAALTAAAREAVLNEQADHPFIQALASRSLLTAAAERAARKFRQLLAEVKQLREKREAKRKT